MEDGRKISFVGEGKKVSTKIISAMIAMKYLRKGYEAFLAFVIDKSMKEVPINELPIMNEFEDVFPKELPSLLPKREIEFRIELLSGTAPISQPLYRMAPAELKKLKVQLQ